MASTLKNDSRQAVVLILDHPAFHTKAHGWRRTTESFASQNANGVQSIVEKRRSYPGSLTLQPGEKVEGLDDAIAECSQVPGLIATRVLSIRTEASR